MSIFKRVKAKRQERIDHIRENKRQELFLRIQKVVAEELEMQDADKIKPTSRFKEDLGVDSLSTIELIMGLENEFGLEVADEDAEKLFGVEDVINYLEKKV